MHHLHWNLINISHKNTYVFIANSALNGLKPCKCIIVSMKKTSFLAAWLPPAAFRALLSTYLEAAQRTALKLKLKCTCQHSYLKIWARLFFSKWPRHSHWIQFDVFVDKEQEVKLLWPYPQNVKKHIYTQNLFPCMYWHSVFIMQLTWKQWFSFLAFSVNLSSKN